METVTSPAREDFIRMRLLTTGEKQLLKQEALQQLGHEIAIAPLVEDIFDTVEVRDLGLQTLEWWEGGHFRAHVFHISEMVGGRLVDVIAYLDPLLLALAPDTQNRLRDELGPYVKSLLRYNS